jgi:acyl-CoA reductase-like NAD-dependent aldehyde dehydrogenase
MLAKPEKRKIEDMLKQDNALSIEEKVFKAHGAQKAWALMGVEKRKECVRMFKHMLLDRADTLAHALSLDTHKPVTQAKNEIVATASRVEFFLEHIDEVLQSETVYEGENGLVEKITYEPLGVVANISAWNYPYFVGTNVIIPALLAGNAVVYKPSEYAVHTGFLMLDALHACGVPKDVCSLVIGDGAQGEQLLKQPIQAVFFTGSYATGVKIAQTCAASLIKVQLELGGKDAVYVCDDVDVKTVAEGVADGAFYNTGQSCCAVERIYVHASVYDAFVAHFVKTVKNFKVGDPLDPSTYIAPLTRASHVEVLKAQVQDAVAKGAEVLCGGHVLGEGLFEPTVLVGVNHSMALMQEESFGPVIGIMRVSSDTEAVSLMNDNAYGLTASVYTSKPTRAEKVLAEMRTGTVYVNACDRVSARLPWTGRGHSGMGSTLGVLGMRAMLQPKSWHIKAS